MRYSHNPNIRAVIFLTVLAVLAASCFWYIVIFHGIPHGPQGIKVIIYLVITTGLLVFLLAMVLRSLINPHFLILRPDGITFSGGWLRPKETFIPFAEIESIKDEFDPKAGARILTLTFVDEPFRICETYLGAQNYNQIRDAITATRKNVRYLKIVEEPPPVKTKPPEPPADDSRYMPKG